MELWIVRHAKAEARGPEWPDDRLRPLTPGGARQAARLTQVMQKGGIGFQRLFASPWIRAAQTAEPLRGVAIGHSVEYLDSLTGASPEAVVNALGGELAADAGVVALVGHEPQLSALASLLVTGDPDGMPVSFRTGSALLLEGELKAGRMALSAFLPAALVESCV